MTIILGNLSTTLTLFTLLIFLFLYPKLPKDSPLNPTFMKFYWTKNMDNSVFPDYTSKKKKFNLFWEPSIKMKSFMLKLMLFVTLGLNTFTKNSLKIINWENYHYTSEKLETLDLVLCLWFYTINIKIIFLKDNIYVSAEVPPEGLTSCLILFTELKLRKNFKKKKKNLIYTLFMLE